MTSRALNEVKERFQHDFTSPNLEWEYLESMLKKNGSARIPILEWVFSDSPAYWDTRARAGLILLQENEQEAWSMLERLVDSADPDDNGSALTVFEIIGDPCGFEYAKRWLADDIHPATQIEAINFLKEMYPDEAFARLQSLTKYSDPDIQKTAKRMMDEFEKS